MLPLNLPIRLLMCAAPWVGVSDSGGPLQATGDPPADGRQAPEPAGPTEELRALLRSLPARTKLGSLRSIRVRSTVTFEAYPAQPHGLTVAFAFPGRTRFELSNGRGGFRERYQLGPSIFAREVRPSRSPEEQASRLLGDARSTEVTLDLAARRALFCWPDGHKWVPGTEGSNRLVAELPGIGRLEATAQPGADDDVPRAVRAVRLDGSTASRLEASAWSKAEGRRWPSRVRLLDGADRVVWTEEVHEVETRWFLGDIWFVPKDRVGAIAGKLGAGRLRLRAHGAAWVRRVLVESDPSAEMDLAKVETRATEGWSLIRRELMGLDKGSSTRLSPVVSIMLDGKGLPTAIEYECSAPKGSRAPGPGTENGAPGPWSRRGPRLVWHDLPATTLGVGNLPSAETLQRLEEAARRSAEAAGGRAAFEFALRLTLSPGPDPDAPARVTARTSTAPMAPAMRPPGGKGR